MTVTKTPSTTSVDVGSREDKTFSVSPQMKAGNVDVTNLYSFTYDWELNDYPVANYYNGYSSYTFDEAVVGSYKLTCTVTPYYNGIAVTAEAKEISWNIEVSAVQDISVTISQSVGEYYFTDSASTQYGESIYDQIVEGLNYYWHDDDWYGSWYDYDYLTISISDGTGSAGTIHGNNYSTYLSELDEVYLDITTNTLTSTATWRGTYSVYYATTKILSGDITISVEPSTGIDILYTATLGQSVDLDVADFDEFWDEFTDGRGTLDSVKINSVTGLRGDLWYTGSTTDVNAEGKTFYVDPTGSQYPLDDLTFIPTKTSNKYTTGSVTINFTAKGTSRYSYGSSSYSTSANGTVTILYTDGEVSAINYTATSNYMMLDADDFDAVYKKATGSTTKNPSYTIRFLDEPTSGTLYANFSINSFTDRITGTEITKSNMGSLAFSNRTTGTNSIEKVAYVPGYYGNGDSVRYAVYSGSSLLYIGTINFGVEEIEITYYCGGSSVTFSSTDFFNSTNSSLLLSNYITFGTPSSGTLYKNYANGKGTKVTAYDTFTATTTASGSTNLSNVTFVPAANYTGVVEIPFSAASFLGSQTNGVVKIYVAKAFPDVSKGYSWAANYITRLTAEGVVNGTSATTFSPGADVKYGEALKMILIAAGYPKQAEGTGNNWASNYRTLAYNYGIISSNSVDLTKAIDRNTVAEIAAKALKISSANSVTAATKPTDSTNGYVYALYNAGILEGQYVNGKNYFYGSDTLNRAELSKIVCMVSDYSK